MRGAGRWISLVLLLAPGLALIGLGAGAVRRYVRFAERALPVAAGEEIKKALGREARVETIRLSAGSVEALGIRIAEADPLASAPFVQVRRLRAVFSLRDLLQPPDPDTPYLRDVLVDGGTVRVARDRAGRWSFDDLLRRQPRRPTGRGIGVVRFQNVTAQYEDAALVPGGGGDARQVRVRLTGVQGAWRSHAGGAMDWDAAGTCVSGQAARIESRGTYRGEQGTLSSTSRLEGASVALARYWLPAWVDVQSGDADAVVAVHASHGKVRYVVTTDARRVAGAIRYGSRFHAPLADASGRVIVVPGAVRLAVSGRLGGAQVAATGVVGTASRPWLDARVRAKGLDVRQAAAWLGASDRLRDLGSARATASFDAAVRGPLDRLRVEASGPVTMVEAPLPGVSLDGPVALNVRASGPVDKPSLTVASPVRLRGAEWRGVRLAGGMKLDVIAGLRDGAAYARFTGRLPSVRWRDVQADRLAVAGAWQDGRLSGSVSAVTVGGRLVARGEWRPADGAYRATVSVRDADLSRLRLSGVPRTRGRMDADARFASVRSAVWPLQARGIVQVFGLNLYRYTLPVLRADLAFDGGRLTGTAVARSGASFAVAAGGVDLRSGTLDVSGEAEGVRLGPIARALTGGADPDVRGQLYLRDLHVAGPWSRPVAAGSVYVLNPGVGDRSADFVRASFVGDTRRILVIDGRAQRLPGEAEFDAVISRPLSPGAVLAATGRFSDLELDEAFRLAGESPAASGVASGELIALGSRRAMTVVCDPLTIRHGAAGDAAFDGSGGLRWAWSAAGTELVAEVREATVAGAKVSGSLRLVGDELNAQARVADLDISLMNSRLPAALVARGVVGGDLDAQGRWGSGPVQVSSGNFYIYGDGLELNQVRLGSLRAAASFDGRQFRPLGDGPLVVLGDRGFRASITAATWDGENRRIAASGGLEVLPLEWLRQAIKNSPKADQLGGLAESDWLRSDSARVPGTLAGAFAVSGPVEDLTATASLTGAGMEIGGQAVERFTAEVVASRERLGIRSLEAAAADAALLARGELVFGERVEAEADITGLTVEQVSRWAPGVEPLQRASGTVDSINVRATGTPDQPVITGSAFLRDVRLLDRPGGAPQVDLRSARVGRLTIEGGQLTVEDAGVTAGSSGSGDRFEATGSAAVAWSWKPPHLSPAAALTASLDVRRQPLAGIAAALPTAGLVADGTLDAQVSFHGVFGHVASGAPPEAAPPRTEGRVAVRAATLRWQKAPYAISDLLANFEARGGVLRVAPDPESGAPFGALIHPLDPVTGRPTDTANLRLTGAIALDGTGNDSLTLEADRVPLRFDPLPIFRSGRVVGELAGAKPGVPGLRVVLGGSLRRPDVRGEATVRKTDLRLPDDLSSATASATSLKLPGKLDFRLQVADQVRLRNAQMVAYVRTPPDGPVRIESRSGDPTVAGTLIVEKGVLQFPTARFAIQPGGQVNLRYPSVAWASAEDRAFAVEGNLRATGRLTARSLSGALRRYLVTVDIVGPLNDSGPEELGAVESARPPESRLRMTFRSEPGDLGATPEEIKRKVIGLLGGQEAIAGLFGGQGGIGRVLGDQVADVLAANLVPEMLERTGLPRALGLEDLSLDYARGQALSLNLSARIGGPLYVGYWQRLSGPERTAVDDRAAWRFSLSYRLRPGWQLSWTVNDETENAFLTEGVFRF